MIRTQVGQLVIRRLLGEGGLEIVYLAEHALQRPPREAAALRAEWTTREIALQRCAREVRAAAAVRNGDQVEVHEVTELPRRQWLLLLDYLEGPTLAQLLRVPCEPLAPERIVHIASEIASGLEAAHELGLVHSDLRPDNIYLGARGDAERVTLLDLGGAWRGTGRAGARVRAGAGAETPAYMAPEQLRGEPAEPATDIFALGVIAYQLTTGGCLPFQDAGMARVRHGLTPAALYRRQVLAPPIDPRRYAPGTSEAWVRALGAALDVDPGLRPPTAAALARLLAEAAPGGGRGLGGLGGLERSGEPAASERSGESAAPERSGGPAASERSGEPAASAAPEKVAHAALAAQERNAAPEHSGGPAAQERNAAPGPRERYRMGPTLGTGGMAEVFLGTVIGAEGFARPVAIKRVRASHSGEPRFATMFIEEAQIASQLSHPNVVSVLDLDRDPEGRLFLVMELVDGKDLAALCAAGRPPPSIAIFVVSEILRGLGYAHELPHASGVRGYVHRDVSPHNVLVSWEGAVKVSDFGIAKALEGAAGVRTRNVRGKPAYMSPEQVSGEALDGRSDLFAVGIILWELLVGTKLFAGGMRETFTRILFRKVPRPSELAAGVPADLEAVAMRLLARDREDRYPTAEAAIEALARCTDNPRNGRSELVRWMAQRFPAEVKSRAQPARPVPAVAVKSRAQPARPVSAVAERPEAEPRVATPEEAAALDVKAGGRR